MRRSVCSVLATTALAFTALTGEVRHAAAEQPLIEALQSGALPTSYAQYRRFGPRYGGYYGRPYGRYYRRGSGAAAAGVIGGLAAGAIIGGAIAQSQAQAAPVPVVPADDAVAYCMQRFRSYDPASGTYVGYDGIRRPCP